MIGFADLSWLIAAAGLVLGASTLVVFRRPPLALHVLLDLLLAAGLLRLSVDATWRSIAVTALVVVVRHLVTRGLALPPPLVFRPFLTGTTGR
ncbi:hypothetical protein [Mycobacterium sp. E740]|uniref:hypothetical protein n=1 Tax=Mycobacterium sp. E740 TaxID=1834149 RepID=UPI0007FBD91D|nr:hypothetical protein [Mycobacterium sp. E740]OBI84918.1 hypothetical protein A5663_10180 [Mycobacterium sp. E740]